MIRIQAYSRLHFGFLNPYAEGKAPLRCFGGAGVMIEQPDLCLRVQPDSAWSAEGTQSDRALALAQRFASLSCRDEQITDLPPHRLSIERLMPAHAGLGSGTQLGLSVARALATSWGLSCDLASLARRVGRGLRSAVGTHGFEHGGFLVESGKSTTEGLAPLVARQPFPESWRLVLALPPHANPSLQGGMRFVSSFPLLGEDCDGRMAGLHGDEEAEALARLTMTPTIPAATETLCRLVLLGMLPALVENDIDAFGEALYEFNVRVGEAFAPVQGGVYASPPIAEVVEFMRSQQIRGIGQSSWGPAVFAVVADAERADHLAAQLRRRFTLSESAVWTTSACNHGARLNTED